MLRQVLLLLAVSAPLISAAVLPSEAVSENEAGLTPIHANTCWSPRPHVRCCTTSDKISCIPWVATTDTNNVLTSEPIHTEGCFKPSPTWKCCANGLADGYYCFPGVLESDVHTECLYTGGLRCCRSAGGKWTCNGAQFDVESNSEALPENLNAEICTRRGRAKCCRDIMGQWTCRPFSQLAEDALEGTESNPELETTRPRCYIRGGKFCCTNEQGKFVCRRAIMEVSELDTEIYETLSSKCYKRSSEICCPNLNHQGRYVCKKIGDRSATDAEIVSTITAQQGDVQITINKDITAQIRVD